MPTRYVAETENGAIIKLELMVTEAGERWYLFSNTGEWMSIVWLGRLRLKFSLEAALRQVVGLGAQHVKVLKHSLIEAIENRSFLGEQIFYVEQSAYENIIKFAPTVENPSSWAKVKKLVSHTEPIVRIYVEYI